MERLYIVVRNDIAPGLQIAQSCHALRAFVERFPELDRAWHESSSNIVVVQCADMPELLCTRDELRAHGVPLAEFFEPDLGGQMTAIAVSGEAKRWLRRYSLALAA